LHCQWRLPLLSSAGAVGRNAHEDLHRDITGIIVENTTHSAYHLNFPYYRLTSFSAPKQVRAEAGGGAHRRRRSEGGQASQRSAQLRRRPSKLAVQPCSAAVRRVNYVCVRLLVMTEARSAAEREVQDHSRNNRNERVCMPSAEERAPSRGTEYRGTRTPPMDPAIVASPRHSPGARFPPASAHVRARATATPARLCETSKIQAPDPETRPRGARARPARAAFARAARSPSCGASLLPITSNAEQDCAMSWLVQLATSVFWLSRRNASAGRGCRGALPLKLATELARKVRCNITTNERFTTVTAVTAPYML